METPFLPTFTVTSLCGSQVFFNSLLSSLTLYLPTSDALVNFPAFSHQQFSHTLPWRNLQWQKSQKKPQLYHPKITFLAPKIAKEPAKVEQLLCLFQ